MNRRTFAHQLIGTAGAMVAGQGFVSAATTRTRVYFGTYTGFHGFSRGIYVAEFNPVSGMLGEPKLAARMRSPSYLEVHPSGRYLYAVGETTGDVHAFAVTGDGRLQFLNSVSAKGDGPCHVNIDKTGRVLVIANYNSGSVASFQIKHDGSLSEAVTFIQNEGRSANPLRQEGPHAHSAYFSPDNHFVLVCDLGLDKIFSYRLDARAGTLTPHGFTTVPPGSGPRHLAFSKNGRHVLLNTEMALTEIAFAYDAENGRLKALQNLSVLPKEVPFSTDYSTAETRVHPNGRWVYVSVRTHDSIARFYLNDTTGRLTYQGSIASGGKTPRDFNIDPSGRWMLVAHQDSHNVVIFQIDQVTGALKPTGRHQRVGGGVCVKFATAI
ncbi:MAG: 6-phosphogluconolactonase [Verrucomicrobiaceae bacterium]|nr:6-phosphogluconolactonase [Verrucomicrobiaceae bacterium]